MTYSRTTWANKVNSGDPITISDHDVNDDDIVSFINDLESKVLLKTDQIDTDNIKNSAITEAKISNNSVTTSKIADGNVTTAKLASKAVTTAKIDDKAVTATQIADNTITKTQIANNTITATQIANTTITATQLASNAVETAKIKDSAVTTDKINNGAVTDAKLASNAAYLNLYQYITTAGTYDMNDGVMMVITNNSTGTVKLNINDNRLSGMFVFIKNNPAANFDLKIGSRTFTVADYCIMIRVTLNNWQVAAGNVFEMVP